MNFSSAISLLPFFCNSSYSSPDNPITAADVTKAIRESNLYTMLDILKDKGMMLTAEERAMDFIRKYIAQISAYSKTQFTVNFEYIESDTK